MKNLSAIALAMLFAVILTSCKKEPGGSGTTSKQTTRQNDSLVIDSVIYYDAADNLINVNDINQNLDYYLLVEPLNNHIAKATYFSNENNFYSFISSNSNYDEVKSRMDFIRNIKDLCAQYNVDLESDDTPPQEIEDYINSWSEPANTNMRATKATGTGVLREHYTHPVYHGASSGFAIYPRWTLGGFRNKASGVQLSGVTILWDKRWFGGASVTAVGFPWGQIPLVSQYGLNFNDRAESLF